ncbi:flavodoxin I [Pelagirhabdus alkalitolerans]|uniref:Flavodoxin I n=1 Tax=Pelagirhabdus alkalitolerans TaxID=1612202 RepID=A0A1G6IHZ5_9BACI|nr:flavodoxin domain-containing protein [Pelagirhabdus alkalitolerans]SDC05356.1 flavodoxin I [Pelagirhabdus alkalitolerans]
MKACIIYSSVTGNTYQLAQEVYDTLSASIEDLDYVHVDEIDYDQLLNYDFIAIGTYTWGSGDLPMEMEPLFDWFEEQSPKHLRTAVFGTGDSFYPNFCGAVDLFRDMLYVKTTLTVTLKVELMPQSHDIKKVPTFCDRLMPEPVYS